MYLFIKLLSLCSNGDYNVKLIPQAQLKDEKRHNNNKNGLEINYSCLHT